MSQFVIVEVSGGIVQQVHLPEGVRVLVVDHDNLGQDRAHDEDLSKRLHEALGQGDGVGAAADLLVTIIEGLWEYEDEEAV